jgi:hypothetical protein
MYCLAFDAGNKDLVPEIKGLVRASIPVSLFFHSFFRLEDGNLKNIMGTQTKRFVLIWLN